MTTDELMLAQATAAIGAAADEVTVATVACAAAQALAGVPGAAVVDWSGERLRALSAIGSLADLDGMSCSPRLLLPRARAALHQMEPQVIPAAATYLGAHARDGDLLVVPFNVGGRTTGSLLLHASAVSAADQHVLTLAALTGCALAAVGQQRRLAAVVEESEDGCVLVERDGTVRWTNAAANALLGDQGSLVDRALLQIVHDDDVLTVAAFLTETAREAGSIRRVEFRAGSPDHGWAYVEASTAHPLDPTTSLLALTLRDVRERRNLEDELAHRASHDPLTNLPNRSRVRDLLRGALGGDRAPGTGIAVLLLDLDGFAALNDSLGIASGDAVLVAMAERLAQPLPGQIVVGRVSGDEFAIVIDGVSTPAAAAALAAVTLASLSLPVALPTGTQELSACIGVRWTDHADDADQLLRDADLALSVAKSAGPGTVEEFRPELAHRLFETVALRRDLGQALKHAQLSVHYQPIVELASERLVGFEALLRWDRPGHGLVSPGLFVPEAERTGDIVAMGEWVLRQACAAATDLARLAQRPISMSVNLSMRQFEDGRLATTVASALADADLDPKCLVLELTESLLAPDNDEFLAQLDGLRALGVRLAIDDFGTGFSSFAYLADLHVDSLKIDQAFVRALGSGASRALLVRTIVKIGETLDLTTVAEGIEEPEQLEALRAVGCHLGQGYLFSRPLPLAAALALLERCRGGSVRERPSAGLRTAV
jgi:diguanylate cyclase (GGDEF)-like protein/PAS domain S-box-containing protein